MPRLILSLLGASACPVPTSDLIAALATGLSHPRQRVWAALRQLERAGLVRRVRGRGTTGRGWDGVVTRWALA